MHKFYSAQQQFGMKLLTPPDFEFLLRFALLSPSAI
jgi:hypothetical protein